MTKLAGALALASAVFFTQAALAADQYVRPHRYGPYAPPPDAYPYLLPPCWDSFGNTLLRCFPRDTLVVPYDDVYTQNVIRGLRPVTRKPYVQVFTW